MEEYASFRIRWFYWPIAALVALVVILAGPDAWLAGCVGLGVFTGGMALAFRRRLLTRIVLLVFAFILVFGPITWIVLRLLERPR